MSLDYQKTTYRGTGGDTLKRTTYSKMNQWMEYIERPAPNPYQDAREGVFRALTPVFTNKDPKEQEDLPKRPHTTKPVRAKLPLPPPQPSPIRDNYTQTMKPHSPDKKPSPQHIHSLKQPLPLAQVQNIKRASPKTVKSLDSHDIAKFVSPRSLERFHDNDKINDGDNGMMMKTLSVPVTVTGRRMGDPERIKKFHKPVHVNYYKSGGYDDFHKAFLKLQSMGVSPSYPLFGPPRLRNGRLGGGYRHVQEVLQAGGNRIVFVDGGNRQLDNLRLAEGTIPAGNILQPTFRTKTPKNKLQQLKMSAYDNYLTGVKGMEKNNWVLVR